ncbi:hypothetical protein HDU83_000319, partial [Entophlyctis luteolus]
MPEIPEPASTNSTIRLLVFHLLRLVSVSTAPSPTMRCNLAPLEPFAVKQLDNALTLDVPSTVDTNKTFQSPFLLMRILVHAKAKLTERLRAFPTTNL